MGERPRRLGLAEEPLSELLFVGGTLTLHADGLDGDHAINLGVPSRIDRTHAPAAKFFDDFVSSQSFHNEPRTGLLASPSRDNPGVAGGPKGSPSQAKCLTLRDLLGLVGNGEERSEEHTSELQSLAYLVCRLLLEKKKKKKQQIVI